MRAVIVLSLAVTTAIISTVALAAPANQAGQNFIRVLPPAAPAVALPVIQIKQQLPVSDSKQEKPATAQFVQPAAKPAVTLPVGQIKQDLPKTRQIVPEAAIAQPIVPAPVATLATQDTPEATGTLQAEIPAAAPVAPPVAQAVGPKAAEVPAEVEQLIAGDAAAAPKPEVETAPAPKTEEVAPQAAPVAPAVTFKPRKKIVRYYVQEEPSYDNYNRDDYGYQAQASYSGGYNDGCQ